MKFLPFFVLSALALPATAAPRGFRPGVEIGYFRFTSSATSNTFGGNGISISPAFGPIRAATKSGTVRPDFSFNLSRSNGNTLVFLPIGARYVVGLSDKTNQPYVGASLNIAPAYTKIEALSQGGKFQVAGGGSIFTGYNFGNRFNIEARYFALSKVRGFDLSHFEIAAGARF